MWEVSEEAMRTAAPQATHMLVSTVHPSGRLNVWYAAPAPRDAGLDDEDQPPLVGASVVLDARKSLSVTVTPAAKALDCARPHVDVMSW